MLFEDFSQINSENQEQETGQKHLKDLYFSQKWSMFKVAASGYVKTSTVKKRPRTLHWVGRKDIQTAASN